ncbi:MAG: hypothetical protein KDI79_11910 [Anaerolineae bacterium]|nr:hypothetical protein [Anaerolineae bacterium]
MKHPIVEPSSATYSVPQLDRYLAEKIRVQIEQSYYAKVSEQAELDCVARDEGFLANPLKHVALYSDHGVVHVRDVATTILPILDTINGVLIPARDTLRLEFMKGYGVILAYNHDIGMLDFSSFGRVMHPEFAAQEVFTPVFDEIVETIWAENWGNISWRLVNLKDSGVLEQPPKLVLREMLAMSVGHSKSKVPIDILNHPAQLRQMMMNTVSTNLRHLYHDQQVSKIAQKLVRVLEANQEPERPEIVGSLRSPTLVQSFGTEKSELTQALKAAQANRDRFLDAEDVSPRAFAGAAHYYPNFEREAFLWLVSDQEPVRDMVSDVTDTIRALRVADALRQRGTVLKTSAGYQILVDQNTGNAIFALEKGSGEMFLVESGHPPAAGEANVGSSELTQEGDLRLSFHRGSFANPEATRQSAGFAAFIIDDIQRDIVDTFQRPAGQDEGLKSNQDIQILIEETDDNLDFAGIILEELVILNANLGPRSRIVPSLKFIAQDERERYLQAERLDWSRDQRKRVLMRLAQSGHKIINLNPDKAFSDVRLTTLKKDQTLITAGAPPGFVYVPMGEGLFMTPLGGYQAHAVKPWIPLGNTRVIRGDVQEATITAQKALRLLMIPKEIYLRYWHDTYTVEEFSVLLPQVYLEEEMRAFEQTLEILRQVAMIDQVLDDAEVEFIQKFTHAYGFDYSAAEMRERLLQGQKTDFVTLRQSVLDYLALQPSHLQAARLKDLLNVLVKIDEEISDEEALILAELNGLFAGYLDEEADVTPFTVWLVPQNEDQDQAIASLMPALPKQTTSGGFAYLAGTYYSKDYAEMISQKYRALQFFTTIDQEAASI